MAESSETHPYHCVLFFSSFFVYAHILSARLWNEIYPIETTTKIAKPPSFCFVSFSILFGFDSNIFFCYESTCVWYETVAGTNKLRVSKSSPSHTQHLFCWNTTGPYIFERTKNSHTKSECCVLKPFWKLPNHSRRPERASNNRSM